MNPLKCSVCTDPETDMNRILNCKKCEVSAHMMCYGVEYYEKEWKCSPCDSGIVQPVCALCLQKNGAMKKTVCGKWVHVICALFTDGVRFIDKSQMEPIEIANVSISKRNKTCVFCEKSVGFCCLCSKSTCPNRLHITCSQRNDCLKEENKNDGTIKFRAYCFDHKPKESSRRISSKFVRGQVLQRKGRKKHLERSTEMNSDWITKPPTENREKRSHSIYEDVETSEQSVNKKIRKDEALITTNDAEKLATITMMKELEEKRPSSTDADIETDKVEKATKRSKNDQLILDEADSVKMWWDTRDLRMNNKSIEDLLNADEFVPNGENTNIENHNCFKDDKIVKVSYNCVNKNAKAKHALANFQIVSIGEKIKFDRCMAIVDETKKNCCQ